MPVREPEDWEVRVRSRLCVPAALARRLASFLLTEAMEDRPLIALPLQKRARNAGERRGRILGVLLPPDDEPWMAAPSRRRHDPPLSGAVPLELVR